MSFNPSQFNQNTSGGQFSANGNSQQQQNMANAMNFLSPENMAQLQVKFAQIQQQYPNGAPPLIQAQIDAFNRQIQIQQQATRNQLQMQQPRHLQQNRSENLASPQVQQNSQVNSPQSNRFSNSGPVQQQVPINAMAQPQLQNNISFQSNPKIQNQRVSGHSARNSISASSRHNQVQMPSQQTLPHNINPAQAAQLVAAQRAQQASQNQASFQQSSDSQSLNKSSNDTLANSQQQDLQMALAQGNSQQLTKLNEPEYSTPEEILEVLRGLPEADEHDVTTKFVEKALYKDSVYEQHMDYVHDRFNRIIKRKRTELQYYNQVLAVRQNQPGALFCGGYMGYGNGWTYNQFDVDIVYPKKRKRNNRVSEELNLTPHQLESISNTSEILVPIRLDIEKDKYRLRDTFTWNLNEKFLPVQLFAQSLLDDFLLPQSLFPTVATSIEEQLKDYVNNRKPNYSEPTYTKSGNYIDEDLRITVKLDITVGQHNLVDQFEWDVNCPENSPEEFAEVMCRELNLSGEFKTAIAHSIREQTQLLVKSLALIHYPFDGTVVEDEDIRRELCPPIIDYMRAKAHFKEFSPALFEISELELDRQDRDRDRDSRRKRRQGRAGRRNGPALPDFRETLRTFRTPVYSSVLPGSLDHNVELLRRMLEEERNDEDEAKNNALHTNSAAFSAAVGSHRSRHFDRASSASFSGHVPPKPLGRPPLNRHVPTHYGANSSANSSFSSHYSSPQPESYLVSLKIPRLGLFLERIEKTSFR